MTEVFFPKTAVSSEWESLVHYLRWWRVCPLTPWTQSLSPLRSPFPGACVKGRNKRCWHIGHSVLRISLSSCRADALTTKMETPKAWFISNKPAAHWLPYLLIWRESPIFIRSTCTLPGEIIFNIRKRAFGGFIFAAWNQQVIFVSSQFSSVVLDPLQPLQPDWETNTFTF